MVRSTKKDLLQAVGVERLAAENRELVATEQRALGGQFDRSIGEVEGGWIGSPMEAAAMERAKDRDILKIFREIPDNTNWDHPTHRSEEHTSELQSLMRISYAVFCLKKKKEVNN